MPRVIDGYIALFLSAKSNMSAALGVENDIGKKGRLDIYVSERLHPGEKFVVFTPNDKEPKLQTSCGDLCIDNGYLVITTQNGENRYVFKLLEHIQIIDFKLHMPEKFWHICSGCGKKEYLSSLEAFNQGWDFPGKDGIYKNDANFGFGMFAPRTCEKCSIDKSSYWRLMTGELDKRDKRFLKEIERINNEPWSLLETNED